MDERRFYCYFGGPQDPSVEHRPSTTDRPSPIKEFILRSVASYENHQTRIREKEPTTKEHRKTHTYSIDDTPIRYYYSTTTMIKLVSTLHSWILFHWLLTHCRVQGWIPSSPSVVFTNARRSIILRQQGSRVVDGGADFFRERQSDFVRLEQSDEEFGPGPALIFYNVPHGIQDEELVDMLRDGAPRAIKKGVSLTRMDTSTTSDWMDLTLEDALKRVVRNSKDPSTRNEEDPLTTDAGLLATTPVLFFSGFRNSEMMTTFNIISHEVHKETGGRLTVACAMAVPAAMKKPLKQVLMEISGDHEEAVSPRARRA